MKKLSLIFILTFAVISGIFADVEIRLAGNYFLDLDQNLKNAPGATTGLDFSPFTIRGRDSIFFSVDGAYSPLTPNQKTLSSLNMLEAQLAAGYNCRFSDRFSAGAEAFAGLWSVPKSTAISSSTEADSSEAEAVGGNGLLFGGRAFVNYYLLPELSINAYAGYKYYQYLTNRLELGIGIKYNFSKGMFGTSAVAVDDSEEINAGPLFPVFYSRYIDHSFGTVTFINNEKNDITDVEVSVFIEQFMTNPDVSARYDVIKRGESFTVELKAFLNESILNTLIAQKADAQVIVKYRSLGKTMTSEQIVELTALSRNSMTWVDDRAAAAFISARDASAAAFARQVKAIVQDKISTKSPENQQYGAALFGALKAYGLNYVVDPTSAFTDNVGTASVDFLKFPYQTLLYRGGDCDDLTILNCALYEALGIETALITAPGHIFMAFDSGITEEEVSKISDGAYIIRDGKVWIPVEVTLCQESFALARQTAIREWRKFKEECVLIPLKDAWAEYKAVGIPDSDVKIEMPSKAQIINGFNTNTY